MLALPAIALGIVGLIGVEVAAHVYKCVTCGGELRNRRVDRQVERKVDA